MLQNISLWLPPLYVSLAKKPTPKVSRNLNDAPLVYSSSVSGVMSQNIGGGGTIFARERSDRVGGGCVRGGVPPPPGGGGGGGVLRFGSVGGVPLKPPNPYLSLRVILAEKGTHY